VLTVNRADPVRIRPVQIKYPYSFWMTIGIIVITALLSVAWHGLLFIVAVMDIVAIALVPIVSRYELRHADNSDEPEQPTANKE
jgi:hypothetical protein